MFLFLSDGIRAQNNIERADQLISSITDNPDYTTDEKIALFKNLIAHSQSTHNYYAETWSKDLLAQLYYIKKEYNQCFKLYDEISTDSRKTNNAVIIARTRYAKILADAGLFESAVSQEKLNLDDHLKTKSPLYACLSEREIAIYYSKAKNIEKAELHFMNALNAKDYLNPRYIVQISSVYNSVGVFYCGQKKTDEGLKYYNEALHILKNHSPLSRADSILIAHIKGNLGNTYYKIGDKKKGIDYLNQAIQISKDCKQYPSLVNAILSLAIIYSKQNDHHKVISTLDLILDSDHLANVKYSRTRLHDLYYSAYSELNITSKANEHFHEFRKAWKTHDSIKDNTRIKIEHAFVKNAMQAQKNRLFDEQQDHKNKMALASEREKFNQLRTTTIIVVIITMALFIVILLRKRIKKNEKKLAFYSLEEELAKEKLRTTELERVNLLSQVRLKNKDLTDFAIDISRKHELLLHVKQEINLLKSSPPSETEEKIKELLVYVNNQLIVDQNLIEFQNNVESINHEFFKTLTEKYPSLTQTDRKIAGLIRLNLSNKEIALMRGVSYNSAKISRYRLRKKMNLDETVDIVAILQNL